MAFFPALLEWQTPHPAPQLPDHGLRLTGLTLCSPDLDALRAALPAVTPDGLLSFAQTAQPTLRASLSGPGGSTTL